MEPVLAQEDRDRRQLRHLVARRLPERLTLCLAEAMAAPAAQRPVVDHLLDRLHGLKRATVAQVARLSSLAALSGRGPPRARRPPRVLAGGGCWLGGVEEWREFRFRRRSSSSTRAASLSIRASWIATRSESATRTPTTTSRPWS